jgi:hypothetical protein
LSIAPARVGPGKYYPSGILDGLSLLQIRTLLPASPTKKREKARYLMQQRYWLDGDPVALAVLVNGIGMIRLLALSI